MEISNQKGSSETKAQRKVNEVNQHPLFKDFFLKTPPQLEVFTSFPFLQECKKAFFITPATVVSGVDGLTFY